METIKAAFVEFAGLPLLSIALIGADRTYTGHMSRNLPGFTFELSKQDA